MAPDADTRGLRIGELADLAGTTTRAIRHYHTIGLLGEPARDDSGYRRYGPEHLVRLVRIRRLRALDMPLEQIAGHLGDAPPGRDDLDSSLRSLADDIGRQIEELRALRTRVLELASSGVLVAPAQRWHAALRAHGVSDDLAALPAQEQRAVALLDALHPDGVDGLIAQSSHLLSRADLRARLAPLLDRFRTLPDDDAAVEALAVEVAALLPRPDRSVPQVRLETMDELLGASFTGPQRRFLRRLRQLLGTER
jgi:DNA-binding transcriptional MerR regulator